MDLDTLKKLPREVQIVLGGTVLYIILSFFDWQSYSYGGFSVGKNEWNGIGIICVLLAIVLLAWELTRLLNMNINTPLTPGQVSVGLALLLALFTVITFLDWSQLRSWPEWVGTIVALVIAGAAVVRAKAEGVTMPEMPKNISVGAPGAGSAVASPPASTDDTAPGPDSTDA